MSGTAKKCQPHHAYDELQGSLMFNVAHRCQHFGEEVRVGKFTIKVGGASCLLPEDLVGVDVLVPLLSTNMPFGFRGKYHVIALPLKDFGGVPKNWREGVGDVISELESGKCVLAFCFGGHGRTGTLLASLIALLEKHEDTPDPIQAVRDRYCSHAVETLEQARGIFALRNTKVPERYLKEFRRMRRTTKK